MLISVPRIGPGVFRGLSVANIVLWILSTAVTTIILTRYSNFGNGINWNPIGSLDYVFSGIWAGMFCGIAGMLGMCASYNRNRNQLIAIGVFNSLAIVGAAVAMGLSGTIASYIMENKDDPENEICHPEQIYPPIYTNVGKDCVIWATLEYTLMSYSIAEAIVNALQLVLVLVAVLVPKRSGIMC